MSGREKINSACSIEKRRWIPPPDGGIKATGRFQSPAAQGGKNEPVELR
jgi:hypothetical protein